GRPILQGQHKIGRSFAATKTGRGGSHAVWSSCTSAEPEYFIKNRSEDSEVILPCGQALCSRLRSGKAHRGWSALGERGQRCPSRYAPSLNRGTQQQPYLAFQAHAPAGPMRNCGIPGRSAPIVSRLLGQRIT